MPPADFARFDSDYLVKYIENDYLVNYGSLMASKVPSSPRPQRTRTVLIAAGLDLLVDRPIDAIPIDDLVARAGVAKGSFFNHFADKHDFAAAVAAEVRMEVETAVARANAGVADPVERIAGGMAVAARFAVDQPRRTMVLLRSQVPATSQTHPLNRGLSEDIDAALAQGLLRPEAASSGLIYWLGLCQMLMVHIIETRSSPTLASERLGEMLLLGLTGLGVPTARAEDLSRLARLPLDG